MSQSITEFYIVSYQDSIYKGQSFNKADKHLTKGLKQNQEVAWTTITTEETKSTIKVEYFKPTGDTENPRTITETITLPNSALEIFLKKAI